MVHHKNHRNSYTSQFSSLIAASVVVVSAILSPVATYADQYDAQIKQKQAQQDAARAQAQSLGVQANDVQAQVNALQTQIASIQAQIDTNTAKQNELTAQIETAQKKLEEQKELLSANIRSMYIEGDITPLEMIASSKNLGDFVDKQEYRDRIKDNISATMDEVERLKKQLDDQKKEVTQIIDQQKALRGDLDQKNAEAGAKLTQLNQDKSAFDASVASLSKEISQLKSAQAQMYRNISGGGSYVPPTGSYGKLQWRNLTPGVRCGGGYPSPWCTSLDGYIDTWRLYSSECVSYAAWKMSLSHHVSSFRGRGNAYLWPQTVTENGDGYWNSTPAVGSVMVMPRAMIGGVGHVAVVEAINGEWIKVSQYNWQPGVYSEMEVRHVPGLQYVHFTR
jgi:peptidoglycan hydrolase CwlO-like protein